MPLPPAPPAITPLGLAPEAPAPPPKPPLPPEPPVPSKPLGRASEELNLTSGNPGLVTTVVVVPGTNRV